MKELMKIGISAPFTFDNFTGEVKPYKTVIHDLVKSGTAFPDITNIIFNESKSKSHAVRDEHGELVIDPNTGKPKRELVSTTPKLSTTVYFADGSKVSVTNSDKDPVTDAAGNFTHEAYERGVIYAIVKRLFSTYTSTDRGLSLKCEGFGRRLNELVDSAYNVRKAEAEKAAAKEAAHKEHAEREAAAKANPRRRFSLGETVAELAKTVASLSELVTSLKPASKEA